MCIAIIIRQILYCLIQDLEPFFAPSPVTCAFAFLMTAVCPRSIMAWEHLNACSPGLHQPWMEVGEGMAGEGKKGEMRTESEVTGRGGIYWLCTKSWRISTGPTHPAFPLSWGGGFRP